MAAPASKVRPPWHYDLPPCAAAKAPPPPPLWGGRLLPPNMTRGNYSRSSHTHQGRTHGLFGIQALIQPPHARHAAAAAAGRCRVLCRPPAATPFPVRALLIHRRLDDPARGCRATGACGGQLNCRNRDCRCSCPARELCVHTLLPLVSCCSAAQALAASPSLAVPAARGPDATSAARGAAPQCAVLSPQEAAD